MDEIETAFQIAIEKWNQHYPHHKIKGSIKSYAMQGNLIVVDAVISFNAYTDFNVMDGQFTIGDNKSWDDPIQFVYCWLECFEECYNAFYE